MVLKDNIFIDRLGLRPLRRKLLTTDSKEASYKGSTE
jgi:hypothetical protein